MSRRGLLVPLATPIPKVFFIILLDHVNGYAPEFGTKIGW